MMNVQPKFQTFTCPCCGGFIGEAAPIDDVSNTITATQHLFIFRLLTKKLGKPVTSSAIEHELWRGVRNSGPQNARGTVYVLVCKLNKHLEKYGWHIASTGRGEAGGYRLIPVEAGQ